MPCACRAPVETYPENAEWGPLFWKLLHGLAELSGKQGNVNLQKDEVRTWIQILDVLKNVLPCDICRAHYVEWLLQHDVNVLLSMNYSLVNNWVRNYLWSLHNTINEGNDKPIFSFDQLVSTYKGVDIKEAWKALEPVMKKAITLNGVSLLQWKKWLGYVRNLQGMY
jgi:hypothetical protein